MSDEIRSFTITGAAAQGVGGVAAKKRRATRKRGGEEDIPIIRIPNAVANTSANGNLVNNVSNSVNNSVNALANSSANQNMVMGMNVKASNTVANTNAVAKQNLSSVSANVVNVVKNLAPSNNVTPVVTKLNAPMANVPQTNSQPTNQPEQVQGGDEKKIRVELRKKTTVKKVQLHPKKDEPQKHHVPKKMETRKKHRKVLLGVSSLRKRMTRAKKVQKKVKEMPLDKLKEELIQKKLIKPTSKAPESVLRQIATDAQIVAEKAL